MVDRRTSYLIAGILPLLLAACNGDAAPEATATEVGEVLPGTITDDMLPLDTVTSQPPLMQPEPTAGARGPADGAAADGDATDADAQGPAEAGSDAAPATPAQDAAGDAAAD